MFYSIKNPDFDRDFLLIFFRKDVICYTIGINAIVKNFCNNPLHISSVLPTHCVQCIGDFT